MIADLATTQAGSLHLTLTGVRALCGYPVSVLVGGMMPTSRPGDACPYCVQALALQRRERSPIKGA